MIFERDASRLAIYISLGHRDNIFFCLGEIINKSKNQEKQKSLYRQEVPELILTSFLVQVFATQDLQNHIFC